jgi:hypothetical protein
MVKVNPKTFTEATSQMIKQSGVGKVRFNVKLRHKNGTMVMKLTDDRTTLTCTLTEQSDIKVVEACMAEVLAQFTAHADPATEDAAATAGGKGKKGKGRK